MSGERAYGPDGVKRSSKRSEWRTPQWLFDLLNEEFRFTLDAAAQARNALCRRYIHPGTNGLSVDWRDPAAYSFTRDTVALVRSGDLDLDDLKRPAESIYVNPPWKKGSPIDPWVRKMVVQSKQRGQLIVANVPANTDCKWWHAFVMPYADEVRLVKARVKYGDPDTGKKSQGAPVGTAILVYRPHVPLFGTIEQPHHAGKEAEVP